MDEKVKGMLVIIGGAEDKEGNCTILNKLAGLTKDKGESMVILTAASQNPTETGNKYLDIFSKLGVEKTNIVNIQSRDDANNLLYSDILKNASCIFFTGGDQLRITSLIGGTNIQYTLQNAYEDGVIIAGTSAGASVMSETMITDGNNDAAPKKCTLKMAPGLGLLKDVVLDQHFAQRGRIGRLLTAIAQNPHVLGIGIDEDTAIIVMPDATFEVIGSNAVTIIDGSNCEFTNVSELKPDEILAFTNIKMHVLPKDYKFDIKTRKPMIGR